ncbi:PWI domain-containing protein [Ephemerocybe angulata]|uniref:PWI domain-containing protein n=1 Tax=Ephemerocybe angulata TaxID=980116 RepID=A0A8H6IH46_9AGAR|nr:PWI domain-containing protein [Tulosesus angulatus]
MADAGFFKGTSAEQDRRFSDKELKLMKSMKFPVEFEKKVDTRKVNMSVIRPWVASKIVELTGFEDEVVIEYAMGLLEDEQNPNPDPRKMQIALQGFLTKHTATFMTELWKLLVEAQEEVSGVPRTLLEQKKEELRRNRESDSRAIGERDRRMRLDEADVLLMIVDLVAIVVGGEGLVVIAEDLVATGGVDVVGAVVEDEDLTGPMVVVAAMMGHNALETQAGEIEGVVITTVLPAGALDRQDVAHHPAAVPVDHPSPLPRKEETAHLRAGTLRLLPQQAGVGPRLAALLLVDLYLLQVTLLPARLLRSAARAPHPTPLLAGNPSASENTVTVAARLHQGDALPFAPHPALVHPTPVPTLLAALAHL